MHAEVEAAAVGVSAGFLDQALEGRVGQFGLFRHGEPNAFVQGFVQVLI